MSGVKDFLKSTPHEDQARVIRAYCLWAVIEAVEGVRCGRYQLTREQLLQEEQEYTALCLKLDDAANLPKSYLKSGLMDIFRGLPIMQVESTGPQLNSVFRAHLGAELFEKLYAAVGLSSCDLQFASSFPVNLPTQIS